ncbi:MAG: hypothetical protein ABIC57_01935 [bacterium]
MKIDKVCNRIDNFSSFRKAFRDKYVRGFTEDSVIRKVKDDRHDAVMITREVTGCRIAIDKMFDAYGHVLNIVYFYDADNNIVVYSKTEVNTDLPEDLVASVDTLTSKSSVFVNISSPIIILQYECKFAYSISQFAEMFLDNDKELFESISERETDTEIAVQ